MRRQPLKVSGKRRVGSRNSYGKRPAGSPSDLWEESGEATVAGAQRPTVGGWSLAGSDAQQRPSWSLEGVQISCQVSRETTEGFQLES